MAYVPKIGVRYSKTLRRIAWGLEQPMTRTLEMILEDAVQNYTWKQICTACKDPNCDSCAFYDSKNMVADVRINEMVDTVQETSKVKPIVPRYEKKYGGKQFRVNMVAEGKQMDDYVIKHPQDVYNLVKDELSGSDREIFMSILMAANGALIGVEKVFMGSLNQCHVNARDIFKSAILANACSLIICHNHPSGSVQPSPFDIKLTDILLKAGDMINIPIADHIIVAIDGYYSMKQDSRNVACHLPWAA